MSISFWLESEDKILYLDKGPWHSPVGIEFLRNIPLVVKTLLLYYGDYYPEEHPSILNDDYLYFIYLAFQISEFIENNECELKNDSSECMPEYKICIWIREISDFSLADWARKNGKFIEGVKAIIEVMDT